MLLNQRNDTSFNISENRTFERDQSMQSIEARVESFKQICSGLVHVEGTILRFIDFNLGDKNCL